MSLSSALLPLSHVFAESGAGKALLSFNSRKRIYEFFNWRKASRFDSKNEFAWTSPCHSPSSSSRHSIVLSLKNLRKQNSVSVRSLSPNSVPKYDKNVDKKYAPLAPDGRSEEVRFSFGKPAAQSRKLNSFARAAGSESEFGSLSNCSNSFRENESGEGDALSTHLLFDRRITDLVHCLWSGYLLPGDFAIDATCGNGFDTLEMAKRVTATGLVLAVDVQEEALHRTEKLLREGLKENEFSRILLMRSCHSNLDSVLNKIPETFGEGKKTTTNAYHGGEEITAIFSNNTSTTIDYAKRSFEIAPKLIALNLGYLPHGDKQIKTKVETTRRALEASVNLLGAGGLITVVAYPGHDGGKLELETVLEVSQSLNPRSWGCLHWEWTNVKDCPHTIVLAKKSN